MEYKTTKDIKIPKDPLERVIGQDHIIRLARISAKQRRHLLLVGPPGTGKSMIAQAIASLRPKPKYEVSVLHNEQNPERPIVEVRTRAQVQKEKQKTKKIGKIIPVHEAPVFVTERLGYRCKRCSNISPPSTPICPYCGNNKFMQDSIFDDLAPKKNGITKRVRTTKIMPNGKEEVFVYERNDDKTIRVLSEKELKKLKEREKKKKRNIIVPLSRSLFVQSVGASETELLGDVKHDPYGDHPAIGSPPYTRVVAGAIHEAHEGVLFIDELSTLGDLQRSLLTAMQEKRFPIVGRNATSTGAAVKVEDVPSDFILVAATNISDIDNISAPLRSRIRGEGYEVLVNTWMPDTEENQQKIAQFVAQEIRKDGRIPDATREAVEEIIDFARITAKRIDNVKALTLRLRLVGGLIRLAGDLAVLEGSEYIEKEHVKKAIPYTKSIEEQLIDKFGDVWRASGADYAHAKRPSGTETL